MNFSHVPTIARAGRAPAKLLVLALEDELLISDGSCRLRFLADKFESRGKLLGDLHGIGGLEADDVCICTPGRH